MSLFEDMGRIRSETARIIDEVKPWSHDDREWGKAWLETLSHRGVGKTLAACSRVILEGSKGEAEEARRLAVILRRGWRYASQVAQVERDYAGLVPLGHARERLAQLGTRREGESLAVSLDRAMMANRAANPDGPRILRRVHAYVRAQFPEIEVG